MGRDPKMFVRPELIDQFKEKCAAVGLKVVLTSVDRSYKEQTAYFAQGRETLEITNSLRKAAGLPPIGEEENKKKITWTMNSKHIINLDDERTDNDRSNAFDFAIVGVDGKINWDVKADINKDNVWDYLQCAMIGESLGLTSGRVFKSPDYPHLEIIS
jgi:hypothetical protein